MSRMTKNSLEMSAPVPVDGHFPRETCVCNRVFVMERNGREMVFIFNKFSSTFFFFSLLCSLVPKLG